MPELVFPSFKTCRGRAGFLLIAALLPLWSCGDGVTTPPPIARVVVSPGTDTITFIGGSAQYSARVERLDGSVIRGASVTWSVADGSVAAIDPVSGLATGLGSGTTTVRASAEGTAGTASLVVDPRPDWMGMIAGDEQVGPPGEALTIRPEVEVRDRGGTPISGIEVTFSVTEGGGWTGGTAITGATGRASTIWVLGEPGSQRLVAEMRGGISVEFRASADPTVTVILDAGIRNAHVSVPYDFRLEVRGGTGPYSWTVAQGALPAGLELAEDGRLTGEPQAPGLFSFAVRVHPATGTDAIRDLQMRVCDAPQTLVPGSVASMEPPPLADCGLFLRAGKAHRYRLAIVRYDVASGPDPLNVETATLTTTSHYLIPSHVTEAPTVSRRGNQAPVRLPPERSPSETAHSRVRLDEIRLIGRYGDRLRVLPSRTAKLETTAGAPARFRYDPPRDLSTCTDHADRTALLIAQNERVAVFQDSIQRETLPVSETAVQKLLDYYAAYGHSTLTDYTGGLPDVNGDGILVVVATSEGPGNEAAMVWSGDLFDAQTCPGSNEMEIAYFDTRLINQMGAQDSDFRAAATLVHEAKHVASFYQRLRNFARTGIENPYHPAWLEEGTAEIVAEAAARRAWAAEGGPPVDYEVTKEDLEGFGPTLETAQVFLSLERGSRYLSKQPNAVTVAPVGGDAIYGIYGSGWMFHRFLADGYYGSELEADFFRAQNDSLTKAGIPGLESLTGNGFSALLKAFATALMFNGTGAPTSAPGFRTYDFASAMTHLVGASAGAYPWAVTGTTGSSAPFSSATFSGPIGESGIRIHEFTSDGTETGIEVHVEVPSPAALVVTRIR